MAGRPLGLWNHWSIQMLVLLSLALQVVLFAFAGIRRREAHHVRSWALQGVLWLAYQLADSTAIYALGLLALSSATREDQLVAFWAPFLLLHLGGPDSITAYALQDNQLWLRHLLNLVVQVLAAAYVLYKHVAGNGSSILLAAMLMFAVGLAKYGERTWALRCSKLDNIRSSLKEPPARHQHSHPLDQGRIREEALDKEEFHLRRAHPLFHISKRAIVDSWIEDDLDSHEGHEAHDAEMIRKAHAEMIRKAHEAEMIRALRDGGYKGMWIMMEMELSLLYDILYTKAAVIHTWPGYCIRVVSPLATAASLLLFQFSGKDGHSRVDVAVTYALLAGAFLLETTSLLSALGSTWTYAFLCATRRSWLRYEALCSGRWDRLRRRLRRLVKTITRRQSGRARRWSGKIGQYNMLHLCVRRDTACIPLLGRLAKIVGFKEWWNTYYYSGTLEISYKLKQWLFEYIEQLTREDKVNSQGVLRKNWGQEPLESRNLYEDFKEALLGVELQEGIIIWHIGTDVFLLKSSGATAHGAADLVEAIRTLSNYMMFLIVDRPYMLPGLAHIRLYQRTCENLVNLWREYSSPNRPNRNIFTMLKELFRLSKELFRLSKELFRLSSDGPNLSGDTQRDELARMIDEKLTEFTEFSSDVSRLFYAKEVAQKLLQREKKEGSMAVLELLCEMWLDFLVYTANRCNRESHAKKLSSGGELTTILWLMIHYLHKDFLNHPQSSI